MKISRILAYRVELPLHETTYKWSTAPGLGIAPKMDVLGAPVLIIE